ncbi:hypothetical protein [Cytobacillus massiliigabonensis]|uniref:hypothetical protein n=1 Tax=Cytobacillus massiliigabonensis TaxID=1871011 RepID=UPI00115967F1|nr:hypothetical protein [Cytobacillus massiliigabonensis]
MLQEVKNRLQSLGITVSTAPSNTDEMVITFSIEKVTNFIKNQTNLNAIPEGLLEIAIDMIAGEFLFTKKSMGLLNIDSIDFGLIEKQVQEGDTNVTFVVEVNSTPEAQFNAFVQYLRHNEVDFVRYRVLLW